MPKVIIDGNLIDLEMITHIQQPIDLMEDTSFTIFMVGKKSVEISRFYGTSWRTELLQDLPENKYHNGCVLEYRTKREKAITAVRKMYDELIKRWSPTITKFDD